MMEEAGAETVVLGSCIKLGTPVNYSCPHLKDLFEKIDMQTEEIEIIDWTHYSTFKEILFNGVKNTGINDWQNFFVKGLKL